MIIWERLHGARSCMASLFRGMRDISAKEKMIFRGRKDDIFMEAKKIFLVGIGDIFVKERRVFL